MARIQIKVKDETKEELQKILKELGMNMTSAVDVFLRQVIATKGLPFFVMKESGFTPELEAKVLHAARDGVGSPAFSNLKDAIAQLDSEEDHSTTK